MDAYTTALTLLSRRELSTAQLRARLARRRFDDDAIDVAIARLTSDRTLDDRRVALAAARTEAAVRRRGRRRAMQRIQQMGVNAATAKEAVDEVFADVDEDALLATAIEKKLKGVSVRDLDEPAKARIARSLVGQGFDLRAVLDRLKASARE